MRTSHPVIKFKLMTSKTGKDGLAPIFLYVQFHGRAVMSTGQRCRPDRFSSGMCTDPAVRLALEAMRNRVERARLLLDLSGDAYDAFLKAFEFYEKSGVVEGERHVERVHQAGRFIKELPV